MNTRQARRAARIQSDRRAATVARIERAAQWAFIVAIPAAFFLIVGGINLPL